jgi:formylmethanofuran dehydrogenase subunit E
MDELRKKYSQGKLDAKERKKFEAFREQVIQKILAAPDEEILSIKEVDIPEPEKAIVYPSLNCEECGEAFMEILGRTVNSKIVCKDCFDKIVC